MKYPGKSGSFKLGPWVKGLNNVKDAEQLGKDEVAASSNVMFDERGDSVVRPGTVKRVDGTSASGLVWATSFLALFFDAGSLYSVNVTTWETTELASGFSSGLFTSWTRVGPTLYFTNGAECGRVFLSDMSVVQGFGQENLGFSVTLTDLGYGSLAPGRYLFATTYVSDLGEESGTEELLFFNLAATGGIGVSVSGTLPSGTAAIRVYMTEANGKRDELRRVAELPGDDLSFTVTVNEFGSPLETLFLSSVPVPEFITAYNGYLFFSLGRGVWASEVMNYGLYHEDHGEVGIFADEVTVLEAGPDGLWVVADRTYAYVGSGVKDFELVDDVFDFPAMKGSGTQIDGSLFDGVGVGKFPYWLSTRGGVIGLRNGQVKVLSRGQAEPDIFAKGVSGVVEYNGQTTMMTALEDKIAPRDAMTLQDSFEVTVINRGITE